MKIYVQDTSMRILLFMITASSILVTSCTSIKRDVIVAKKDRLQKELKIAVFPFSDPTMAEGKGSGEAVAEALTNELIKIPHWTVVERSQLSRILGEKTLNMSGLTDAQITDAGRLAKTDYVIVGSVTEFHYSRKLTNVYIPKTKLTFKARIINTQDGSIAGSLRYTVETGKYALAGCCLGVYFIPYALLTEENKFEEMDTAARDIVNEISDNVTKKSGCLGF